MPPKGNINQALLGVKRQNLEIACQSLGFFGAATLALMTSNAYGASCVAAFLFCRKNPVSHLMLANFPIVMLMPALATFLA
jgi:hypothetical protein